jgi:predicted enzyme related to lactoylglutathione lyase
VRTPTFSVEVITLPVSDVERALRFYVDQVRFTLDVDYSPNDAFRIVQLTPLGSSCSIQIGNGLTDAPIGSVRNVYLVVTDLEAARSRLLERGVEVGEIRHKTPIGLGMGASHPGSTPRAETMPALPTSPIRMATAGGYRNGATGMHDVLWNPNLKEDCSRMTGSY